MKRIAVVVTALALLAAVDAHAYEDGDFQIWHTEGQEIAVTKGWKIPVEEEFRYGNNGSEFFYQHYEAGVAYDINKNWAVTGNYRQVYEGEKGKFKPEYRPFIQVIPKWDIWVFKFENRNRLEYRIFDDSRQDTLRYRNRITVRLPLKLDNFEFAPYVANEVFADINGAIVRQNRFSTGVILDLTKNFKAEVYYMVQDKKKSGRWTDAKILGLKLKVAF